MSGGVNILVGCSDKKNPRENSEPCQISKTNPLSASIAVL